MSDREPPQTTVVDTTRSLLEQADVIYRAEPEITSRLLSLRARLDEPLRVAVVGTVKAGKSTLLNALLSEEIAPTDARECTRVVSWYSYGPVPRVSVRSIDGACTPLPARRVGGLLDIDLGDMSADHVDRVDVVWPASALAHQTLIDTPGMASISGEVSARTWGYLTPEDGPSGADAVVYLMRSLRAVDLEVLQTLHARASHESAAPAVVGVLSRADELGAGRIDAMLSAEQAAARLRDDPALEGLCETVVPVAGLVALAGATLRQSEFHALCQLEEWPRDGMNRLLLSVDRFTSAVDSAPVPQSTREQLVERFGLFGIRLAVALIRSGARDAPTLSSELVRRSGLDELQRVLQAQFGQRKARLKAYSALGALHALLTAHPRDDTDPLLASVEEELADVHPTREMRLLGRLPSMKLSLDREQVAELERVIGGHGTSPRQRLGADTDDFSSEELRSRALELLRSWRSRAQNPLTDPPTAAACRVAAQSCEGVLAALE